MSTQSLAQKAYNAILAVLEESPGPLSCGEIIDRALAAGKLEGSKKDWEATVQAKLFYEVSKAKNPKIYKPSLGRFAIKPVESTAVTKGSNSLGSDKDDISKLREEVKALKEENVALKTLLRKYMT